MRLNLARPAAASKVTVLDSVEAIAAMEQEWRALEAANATPCLFQSFDWCLNHAGHARDTGRTLEPRTLAVHEDGRLVALLPLCLQVNKGVRVLTGFTEPFQQYTEMLLEPGADARRAFDAMMPALRKCGADYLHLGQVRSDSNLAEAVKDRLPCAEADAAPFVAIGQHAQFDDYLAQINPKSRKNMRNSRNRLERLAPVTHETALEGEALAAAIDRSFDGREAWLERQGLTSRAFSDPDFGVFLNRFKLPRDIGVVAVAFTLRHGDKVIADQWGFIHKGRYYAFIASWNGEYEEASPGKLHLGEVLRECHAMGIETADFLIPASPYKFTWAKEAMPVGDYILPLSLKGAVFKRLWLDWLRPLAKKTVYSMPSGLRARLFRLARPGRS